MRGFNFELQQLMMAWCSSAIFGKNILWVANSQYDVICLCRAVLRRIAGMILFSLCAFSHLLAAHLFVTFAKLLRPSGVSPQHNVPVHYHLNPLHLIAMLGISIAAVYFKPRSPFDCEFATHRAIRKFPKFHGCWLDPFDEWLLNGTVKPSRKLICMRFQDADSA